MREITGNLLDPTLGFKVIGHGVNTQGAMAAGIAGQIADRWPGIVEPYRAACRSGKLRLGGWQPYVAEDGPVVLNLASQDMPGRHADLRAVWSSVSHALAACWQNGYDHLALPEIGCGIGGLEWDEVRGVLTSLEFGSPVSITVVHFDG